MSDIPLPAVYRTFEHTADTGLIICGKTLKELFAHGGFALFDFMADLSLVRKRIRREISLSCFDREELFVRWLSELLYLHEAEHLLLCRFSVLSVRGGKLIALAEGESYKGERHRIHTLVKAVTYHGMEIAKRNGLWEARVILDL
ncbi:MAG: archease [Candidatus Eremiobacteraeota bacterium]|nr:archease [Candidatus Eremiobacteraeota bacterium]